MAFTLARLAYGAILIAVLFVPFNFYHTMTEPYVSGALWGFMLPVGYVAAAWGVTVILYSRLMLLKRLGFGYLLIVIGASLLLSFWMFPRELSISLLHGTNMIDMDYSTFSGAVVWLSILTIGAGIVTKVTNFSRLIDKT